MKKNKKYLLFLLILFTSSVCLADKPISFLSLKKSKVYLRVGPSFEHPVKLIYKKKYLPVEILDKSETWRKIKDFENNAGWIHISQLSKKKTAINIKNNSIIHNKSTIYSKPIVRLEIGRLVLIKKCKVKWCKVVSGDFTGWILKNSLWGQTK